MSLRRECVSCQLLDMILHNVAAYENKPVTVYSQVMLSDTSYVVSLDVDVDPTCCPVIFTTVDLHGTPFEHYNIPRRAWIYTDSLFETSSQWAQNRISECLQSHHPCGSSRRDISFLPSRLIDVDAKGLGDDVVLVNSTSIPQGSPYVALSYCWGDNRPECMTTSDTLYKHMQKIPWSTLPATFQDAVKFTRSLGVKYLWIDTICIIQGDRDDWSREAGRMFHVYGNSYVTLVGLYGDSSTSGLRSTSMEELVMKVAELCLGPHRCPIYMRLESHYFTQAYLHAGLTYDRYRRDPEWEPLLRRAWAYQERMIAPRVLYFDRSEIIFQCFLDAACECGATQHNLTNMEKPAKSLFFDKVVNVGGDYEEKIRGLTALQAGDTNREKQREVAEVWREIILEEFPVLDLSFASDKLPALGGIAEQFQKVRREEIYLAGLWSGSLVVDLLWHCAETLTEQRQGYALPTWSWASVQGPIVIKAKCQYVNDNPFGILEDSVLVLRGRALPCLIEWQVDKCGILYLCDEAWSKLNKTDDLAFFLDGPLMDFGDTVYQRSSERQEFRLLEMRQGLTEHYEWREENCQVRSYLILLREEMNQDVYVEGRLGRAEHFDGL
ncbi:HET-domain-containing protein [Hypoxylon sp. FL1857]|nr:HET-domain-containing protein [Hypoxylon sp. FL1857]